MSCYHSTPSLVSSAISHTYYVPCFSLFPPLIFVGYVAPEILRSPVSSGYTNNVDIFSAGVTLYVLLCGYEPFYGECDAELIASNRKASVEYPDEDWRKSKFHLLIVD